MYFSGTIYDDIDFKVQYDFAGGDADFTDIYLGMKNVPYVGHVRVGQFKELNLSIKHLIRQPVPPTQPRQ